MSQHRIGTGRGRRNLRERWLLGMVALTLVRTGCAAEGGPRMDSLLPAMRLSPQTTLAGVTLHAAEPAVSSSEFRPHEHSIFDAVPPDPAEPAPMLRGTTVWQRLRDYHSHDRVRLLTLWESSGGSFSLQAGKKGDPSLQWNSSSLNRGGATRGLLDRALAMALAASAGGRSHEGPGNPAIASIGRGMQKSLAIGPAK